MAKGGKREGAGRKKGVPNKRNLEIVERLLELGCDPIEGMALIAQDKNNTPELRGRMYAELAQYMFPKRKAIEHTGEVNHNYVMALPPILATDEWQKKYQH
jgi:hypothetical protein